MGTVRLIPELIRTVKSRDVWRFLQNLYTLQGCSPKGGAGAVPMVLQCFPLARGDLPAWVPESFVQ